MKYFLCDYIIIIYVIFFSSANVGYLEICIFDDSGEDVRDVLVANNYARKQTKHIFPNESELVLVE